jgi:hypothetical protein
MNAHISAFTFEQMRRLLSKAARNSEPWIPAAIPQGRGLSFLWEGSVRVPRSGGSALAAAVLGHLRFFGTIPAAFAGSAAPGGSNETEHTPEYENNSDSHANQRLVWRSAASGAEYPFCLYLA